MHRPTHRNASRRPYTPPSLRVYGDLRVVTLSNLTMNMNDKGSGSQTMT
jgi:hypothetical protein